MSKKRPSWKPINKSSQLICSKYVQQAMDLLDAGLMIEGAVAVGKAWKYSPKQFKDANAELYDAAIRLAMPIKGKHDKSCVRRQFEDFLYARQWPKHCQTCYGAGWITSPGCSVPYGSTNVNLPDDVDPCGTCNEQNICPRCGGPTVWNERKEAHDNCPSCGFVDDIDHGTPGRPGVECECGLDEYLAAVWTSPEERVRDLRVLADQRHE